jgi:nitroimidazol reductase NimA-like FMN-containing flavoprotein (pyridoxamine 5'-phosphate oxidase superfamily)
MRRSEREVTGWAELVEILRKCDVCRVAFQTKGSPYIVPLTFGFEYIDSALTLWFHGAAEGRKISLIREGHAVGFEMDCDRRLVTGSKSCDYSMEFQSIIGEGAIQIVEEPSEKLHGFSQIMAHYGGEDRPFNEALFRAVNVLRLDVSVFTGKRLIR